MSNLQNAIALLDMLTTDEQRALNTILCTKIRHASTVKAVQQSFVFKAGDVVQFNAKTRGQIHMRVTGFSRDRTKIKGHQLNHTGRTYVGMSWQAPVNMVSASSFVA